jgi:hypothetical protein
MAALENMHAAIDIHMLQLNGSWGTVRQTLFIIIIVIIIIIIFYLRQGL